MSGLETWAESVETAADRIAGRVRRTPLQRSAVLSEFCGAEVWLKLENFQLTGSFKIRGATNKLLSLTEEERRRGVVAASSGNHGMAVAEAAATMGVAARVYVPTVSKLAKRRRIEASGAELLVVGDDCVDSEAAARADAAAEGKVYLSPYNDAVVIAGQGTVGKEIAEDLPPGGDDSPVSVYVALGGGGLIGGMGACLKTRRPEWRMIAASPEQSPAVHVCLQEGAWRDVPCHDTLSDGTAGGVEEGSITLPLCEQVVDDSLLVTEEEIAEALREFFVDHSMMIEGAAGAALAALKKNASRDESARRVVVLCGANIAPNLLREFL